MKKKVEKLSFEDFQLEQLIFEVRFFPERNYLDVIRPFWKEIFSILQDEINFLEEGEETLLSYKDKYEIRVAAQRFAVVRLYPDAKIKEFLHIVKVFYDVCVKFLEIERLNRVGLRAIYYKDCKDAQSVVNTLLETEYIKFPNDLYLIGKGTPVIPNYMIGWKDEEKGINYRLSGKAEKFSFDLPLKLSASGEFQKTIEKTYNQVIFDIDIYLHNNILLGQFFSDEWIKQAFEIGKEEGFKFFGENK